MKKYLIIITLFISCAILAVAKPAKRGVLSVAQPDGSIVEIVRVGDEFSHLTMTPDGRPLTVDAEGNYCYATVEADGSLLSTGVKLSERSAQRRTLALNSTTALSDSEMQTVLAAKKQRRVRRSALPQQGMGLFDDSFPVKGKVKSLVLLVEYADVKFNLSNPYEYFNGMLNDDSFSKYGGTGSCHKYFYDNSLGQFDPHFDVFGPVTLPQKQQYYGANDASGDDKLPWRMVTDAAEILKDQINFADYDLDGDGFVDNVYVYYAGMGEASGGAANTVWPHSWNISEATNTKYKYNGVRLDRYACSNEWEDGKPDGIGTFCHEFSHVMGLPDLYNTVSSVKYTPCDWNIMDYGCYANDSRTPIGYSSFERNALGWIEPKLIDGPASLELQPLAEANECYMVQTSNANEFFLFENRQPCGWDEYIPGHGMLIWHIDFNENVWTAAEVNNSRSHQYVDLVEANNNPSGSESALKAYPWPGSKGYSEFTSATTPAFKEWSGKAINLPLTDIREEGYNVCFDVTGGIHTPEDPFAGVKPQVNKPVEVSLAGFTASWEPVEDAESYLLTVYCLTEGEGGTVETGFGSNSTIKLRTFWSFSGNDGDIYTSSGNYGADKPSLKFAKDGVTLVTEPFSTEVAKIEFWAKNQNCTGIDNYLLITGQTIDGDWVEVSRFYPGNHKSAGTVTIDNITEKVYRLTFTYVKAGGGNLALDDMVITMSDGPVLTVVDGYDHRDVDSATQWSVSEIVDGVLDYAYSVAAVNADGTQSLESDVMRLNLMETVGVEALEATNAPARYYNLQGIEVGADRLLPGLYIRRQGSAARVVRIP